MKVLTCPRASIVVAPGMNESKAELFASPSQYGIADTKQTKQANKARIAALDILTEGSEQLLSRDGVLVGQGHASFLWMLKVHPDVVGDRLLCQQLPARRNKDANVTHHTPRFEQRTDSTFCIRYWTSKPLSAIISRILAAVLVPTAARPRQCFAMSLAKCQPSMHLFDS